MAWDDDAHPDDMPGRRALLCAVVTRAVHDALGQAGSVTANERHLADHWLRFSDDFILVCDLAGLPGEAIRTRYVKGKINAEFLTGHRQVHRVAA